MKQPVALSAAFTAAVCCACASQPQPAEALRPAALSAAQQRGASELACPGSAAEVLEQETIQEPQGTGWYEAPYRAQYTVSVSGCAKRATYLVECNQHTQRCVAGPVPAAAPRPLMLADELQPRAVSAAQQRGTAELDCASATAQVLRAETIQEAQMSGWYDPPRYAAYHIAVSGCAKRVSYLVTCDDLKKTCVAGALRKTEENGPRQLADELQPAALATAQRQGSAELGCPAATAAVLKQATIEEPQTTGWYEPPRRAVYSIAVSGCGKRTAYAVACNAGKKCITGTLQHAAAE